MGAGESHTKIAVDQHHHRQRRVRKLGQQFGVSGEADTGIGDNALCDGRRYQRRELIVQTTVDGAAQSIQERPGVQGIGPARNDRRGKRDINNTQATRDQSLVANHDDVVRVG